MRRASAGRFRQPSFDWPTLIANKDKEIDRLEGAYVANLEKAGVKIVESRAVLEDAHTRPPAGDRRDRTRQAYPDRDRRRAVSRAGDSRPRARDLVERGLPSERIAEAHPDSGRRLYRAWSSPASSPVSAPR